MRIAHALAAALLFSSVALADDTRCTALVVPVNAKFYLDAKGNAPYPGIRARTLLGIPHTKMTWQSDRFVRLDTIFDESAAACYPENFLITAGGRLIELSVEREPGHWQKFWATYADLVPIRYEWPGRWLDQDRRDNLRRMHEAFTAHLAAAATPAPTPGAPVPASGP
jgi:hypothetical protein